MDDFQKEIFAELRAIRLAQQACLHALYAQAGITPNPVPWVGFSVLSESDDQDRLAAQRAEQLEQALRVFGIDPEGVV